MKKKTLIVLLIALCLVLCSCGFRSGTYSAWGYNVGEGHISSRVKNVEINWVDGSVQVAYHGSDEIAFSETAERHVNKDGELRWKLDGETLRIEYAAPGFHSWISPEKHLTLMLPEGMKLDTLKISAVSAQVQAGELLAGEADTQSVSGDVQLEFANAPQKVEANTVSGGVELHFAKAPGIIKADAVSGSITVSLPEDAGFTADVDSVSGQVGGSLPMESHGKGRYTYGDEQCSIDVDTVSGDVWFNGIN